MIDNYTIHDIEIFPNFFSIYFQDYRTRKERVFTIYHVPDMEEKVYRSNNDLIKLYKFLKSLKIYQHILVGFNNLGYDAQVVEYIIFNYETLKQCSAEVINKKLYKLSQDIINCPQEERFEFLVPEWKLSMDNIDLMRQCHYDGKGKATSLKWLEFTMRLENIESLPLPFDQDITYQQIDDILKYNYNDVHATTKFFAIKKFETDLRIKLSEKYGLNLLNASEPRLAREIFGKFLSEEMGIEYRELKERRTYRSSLKGSELVFPYVKFKDPYLKEVHKFFDTLEFNPYVFAENNKGIDKVEKTFKFANINDVTVGLGGIHGCISPGVYEAKGKRIIRDIDVKSYYPNLGIENNLFPEHLSEEYCKVYKDLYIMRKNTPKHDPVNYILKIVLNSTYGLSKEPNNYLHDPKYTFTITINGQLLLLMLAEMLKEKIKDIVFYQLNTDGISIGYDESLTPEVDKILRKWEKLTKLELEDNYYKKMVIVDVNNYLAIDLKGHVKRKGLFAYSMNPDDREFDYHKNPSGLVIPKAIEQHFLYGNDFREYIRNHTDIFDFCYGVKIKRDFNLVKYFLNDEGQIKMDYINQKVCRYYVSTENSSLKKKYKKEAKLSGRFIELEKGYNTSLYNIHKEKPMNEYNINYTYYIKEARKIIDSVEPHAANIKLNLFND